jgi:hypothetical protein
MYSIDMHHYTLRYVTSEKLVEEYLRCQFARDHVV